MANMLMSPLNIAIVHLILSFILMNKSNLEISTKLIWREYGFWSQQRHILLKLQF